VRVVAVLSSSKTFSNSCKLEDQQCCTSTRACWAASRGGTALASGSCGEVDGGDNLVLVPKWSTPFPPPLAHSLTHPSQFNDTRELCAGRATRLSCHPLATWDQRWCGAETAEDSWDKATHTIVTRPLPCHGPSTTPMHSGNEQQKQEEKEGGAMRLEWAHCTWWCLGAKGSMPQGAAAVDKLALEERKRDNTLRLI